MNRRLLLGTGAAALAGSRTTRAQSAWPDRPIRMFVPFPAGGATDIWARLVAEPMGAALRQPIVIENRGGAGGMIGTEAAARAAPDGYTLLFNITTHVQSPVVFRRWPYQLEDFAPLGRMGTTPLVYVIRPEIPARTLAEFVAWARGRDLSFGSYAPGSTGHAMAQLLSDHERLNMTHIAYRGEAPMLTDTLGGRIVGGFHSMTAAGDYIRSGRLRGLACLGRQRVPSLPDLPNFVELRYPEAFAFSGFIGLFGRAGTPAPILARVAQEFRTAMERPDLLRRLAEMDTIAGYLGPTEFTADIAQVLRQWQGLVTQMNLTMDG